MRVFASLFIVVGLTTIAICGIAGGKPPAAANDIGKVEPPSGLIVHEWGTFTSISGSDGARLEFRPLIDNDLPQFVVNRAWQAGRVPNPFMKFDIRSLQRMETPITYFYTDREQEVSVKVGFPKGLLTEFYPPVQSMKPAFDFKKRAEVGNSELDWGKVTLIPMDRLVPPLSSPEAAKAAHQRIIQTLAPDSRSHPHYDYARETDSAFVYVPHTRDASRPAAPVGDHFEKFLFYRGVGNFPLPLTVAAQGTDTYAVSNTGGETLRSLFLVTYADNHLHMQHVKAIGAGTTLTIHQSSETMRSDILSNMVVDALIAEGLYEKEARAMVKTWSDSWFSEAGTRLFYILPRTLTDELLPLTISPAPDRVVRVMVGRMEIISPEEESRITQIVLASATARKVTADQAADVSTQAQKAKPILPGPALPQGLVQMGRLAEPALIRVKNFTKDKVIRTEASLLLDELHQYQTTLTN
jgi:hypothetical protein